MARIVVVSRLTVKADFGFSRKRIRYNLEAATMLCWDHTASNEQPQEAL